MLQKPFIVAFYFSFPAVLVGFLVYYLWGGGYEFFPISAGLSTWIFASIFWWALVKKGKEDYKFGIAAGILTGTFSHYLCWYFSIVLSNIFFYFGKEQSLFSGTPPTLIQGIFLSIFYSFWSFVFMGWLTTFVGGLTGFLLIYLKKQKS